MSSLVVAGAAAVVSWPGRGPLRGRALSEPAIHRGATISCRDGMVVAVGGEAEAGEERTSRRSLFDASGLVVVPGFVDPHTHLPFFGWRADEDAARLSGVPYETIHGASGGIFRSARLLAEAADDDVVEWSAALAGSMLRRGTTTFEMKSGYGLSVEAELRQLRLARRVAQTVRQKTVTTCLAAHAVPDGKSGDEWIDEAAGDLLPVVATEELASACDVYVESIAFALEHAARLAETAASFGLRMRVHADQLADNQTGAFAAGRGFATADHLNHTSGAAVADLAGADTVAVLLPGATFTLQQTAKPPARSLIDAGAVVALGTDLNPGTSPVHSMPFVIALACRLYGLRPIEALGAATVNAAAALGLADEVGRIAPGYRADLVCLDLASVDEIAYRPDHDPVVAVVCAGGLAHVVPAAAWRVSEK